jgi:hypothetical protein
VRGWDLINPESRRVKQKEAGWNPPHMHTHYYVYTLHILTHDEQLGPNLNVAVALEGVGV